MKDLTANLLQTVAFFLMKYTSFSHIIICDLYYIET